MRYLVCSYFQVNQAQNQMLEKLKAHFHPWCNAVVCFCFQTALLLNDALWLAIYFFRLVFSLGNLLHIQSFTRGV